VDIDPALGVGPSQTTVSDPDVGPSPDSSRGSGRHKAGDPGHLESTVSTDFSLPPSGAVSSTSAGSDSSTASGAASPPPGGGAAAEAVFVPLPEGLDEMPPGPELGALLAKVDRAGCNGYQLVELLKARHRQIAWLQAESLSDVYAMAYTYHGGPFTPPVRHRQRDEHLDEEVAFALSWTAYAAEQRTGLAYLSIVRQPAVHAALAAGQIDLPKVKVLLEEVEQLSQEQAATIIAQVLPDAPYDTKPNDASSNASSTTAKNRNSDLDAGRHLHGRLVTGLRGQNRATA